MQEYQITASGKTYTLDPPFFVLATQNPIEQEGTYPLPEAQLDRFMFQLWVDYPSIDQEKSIVQHTTKVSKHTPTIQINKDDLLKYQDLILDVPIPSSVLDYTIQLVASTRPQKNPKDSISNKYLSWGAGPRASQYLILGAKTKALSEGRFSITEEDIKSLAIPVLRHRIIPNYAAEAEGLSSVDIITKLLAVN